ncbi:MAG: hypothetical protein K8R69_01025 [Deltaproteobacteria bacterium]|nr:hypothetical protein [Deltaproteobacteria bacterium]
MNRRAIPFFKCAVLTSALIGMVACGDGNGGNNGNNSGNINPGTGTGNPQADTQSTGSATQANAQVGIQQATAAAGAALKFTSVDVTSVPCIGGGTFIVSGDVTSGSPTTFDLDMNFDGCNLLDGSVSVIGTVDTTLPSLNYDYTIDGDVGANGCVVTFDNYSVVLNIPDFTNPTTGTVTINNSIAGECAEGNTTCVYDNVQLALTGGVPSGTVSCD